MENTINEKRSAEDVLYHFNRLVRWNNMDLIEETQVLVSLVESLNSAVQEGNFKKARRVAQDVSQKASSVLQHSSALTVLDNIGDIREHLV